MNWHLNMGEVTPRVIRDAHGKDHWFSRSFPCGLMHCGIEHVPEVYLGFMESVEDNGDQKYEQVGNTDSAHCFPSESSEFSVVEKFP